MLVVIAGAHGAVARHLTRQLVAGGDAVRGLIRNPDHAADLEADGAEPVVCDLESAAADEIAEAVRGADAAVFAAGAGPGSGAERKWTVDRDGAIKLLEAARDAGVRRYVIVSSVGAEAPPDGDDVFSVYLRAKAEADAAVATSDRDWTIVRPGGLTDDPGTGRVRLTTEPHRAEITREDTAGVVAAVLREPASARLIVYANGGEDRIGDALAALSGASG
jgi:nucleoside-diphosphate-sugar epimerase